MGKQHDDLQEIIKGMKGLSNEAIKTMFLGIIAGYLAQILDILEDMTQGGEDE